MKISMILPVYKVENYIEKCLLSCIHQIDASNDDYEIIIVDDGSPDRSIDKAQRIAEEHEDMPINIIHRTNGGLSAARNTGLECAKGDYVWFIDSDDYIEPDSIFVLLTAIKACPQADIISFTHKTIFETHTVDNLLPQELIGHCTNGFEFLRLTNFYSACNRIYRRTFLDTHKLRFLEGILWEDGEFNIRAFGETERHYCINNSLYNYVRREGSISNSPTNIIKTIDSNVIRFTTIYEWYEKKDLSEYNRKIINLRLTEIIMLCVAELSEIPSNLRKEYKKKILSLKPYYYKVLTKGIDWRKNLVGMAILISPLLASSLLAAQYKRAINRTLND